MASRSPHKGASSSVLHRSSASKVVNLKKKITLIEGQRKALFTSCEKQKAINKERETNIDGELLTMKKELITSKSTRETLLDKMATRPHMNR
jgi:hypothetical protein